MKTKYISDLQISEVLNITKDTPLAVECYKTRSIRKTTVGDILLNCPMEVLVDHLNKRGFSIVSSV